MIKLLDILRENIAEGKQVGLIYHFTTYQKALYIIEDGYTLRTASNRLYGGNPDPDFFSFTRNKNLKSPSISGEVRFTIDGDGLSNRYKIQPFADTASGYGKNDDLTDESEERIDAVPIKGELNFSKYLKSIDVLSTSPDSNNNARFNPAMAPRNRQNLIDYLEDNNIKFNLVDSYK
jgi:hypothetical protein